MSSTLPPPPAGLQKPLNWLQKFLYNVEWGPFPFPQPTISIDHDWPLEFERINNVFVTVAGTLNNPGFFSTNANQHALIFQLSTIQTGAGGWPAAGEQCSLNQTIQGLAVPLIQVLDLNPYDVFPLIGCAARVTGQPIVQGLRPIYMPPSSQLDYTHVSTAGGLNGALMGYAMIRQKVYPLRIP